MNINDYRVIEEKWGSSSETRRKFVSLHLFKCVTTLSHLFPPAGPHPSLSLSLTLTHTHTPSHEHTQFACLSTLCWAAEFTPPLRFLCNKSKIFSHLHMRSLCSCFHTSLSVKHTWRHVCCSSHISVLCFLFEPRTFPDTWFFLFHRDK